LTSNKPRKERKSSVKHKILTHALTVLTASSGLICTSCAKAQPAGGSAATGAASTEAAAQPGKKPNILFIVSDDTGYGDLGPYGGGAGRGMPTPNIDRLAKDGMTFFSYYAQPSCTPGRAAMQTGRIPNRSGMTTVAFQGEGGGLPKAEWTLGSVL
jgi:hypothetical protein